MPVMLCASLNLLYGTLNELGLKPVTFERVAFPPGLPQWFDARQCWC